MHHQHVLHLQEELSEEEKIQQRPLIERMFNDLDLDGSGRLDLDEVHGRRRM